MNKPQVFDQIADINPRSPSAALGEPVSFVAMADVSEQGRLNSVKVRNAVSGYTPFTEGDVLVAKITPCLENGKGAHARHLPVPLGQGSTEFHVVRARPGTSNRYLYHLTRTDRFRQQAEALMTGSAGQRRVPTEFFRRYQLRVPPLEEQRRIAEILDTIDETIQTTERVIAKRRALRAGLAADLLRGPSAMAPSTNVKPNGTLPSPASTSTLRNLVMGEWREQPLGSLITLEYGKALGAASRTGSGFCVYGSNGVVGRHNLALVSGPGIIVGRKGSVGALQWSDSDFWPIDTTYWVSPRVELDLRWMREALRLAGLERLESSTGVPGLNRSDAYERSVPVPPLEEQRQIADILDAVDRTIQQSETELVKLWELRAGLAADLLSGRVRTVAA